MWVISTLCMPSSVPLMLLVHHVSVRALPINIVHGCILNTQIRGSLEPLTTLLHRLFALDQNISRVYILTWIGTRISFRVNAINPG
jgi:hypothetical protein